MNVSLQLITLAFLALVAIVVADKRCDEYFNQPLLGDTMSCKECCARMNMVAARGVRGFFKGCSCKKAVTDEDKHEVKEANYVSPSIYEYPDVINAMSNSNTE